MRMSIGEQIRMTAVPRAHAGLQNADAEKI
jgi:hypothetical protein